MIEEDPFLGQDFQDIAFVKVLFVCLEKRGIKLNPYLKRVILVCFTYRHFLIQML